MKKLFLLPCFLVCLIGFCYGADAPYKFTILDIPIEYQGQPDTLRIVDRNNKGEMVGEHQLGAGYYISNRKTVTQINCPDSVWTTPSAINNTGQIGGSCLQTGINGFVLDRRSGAYTTIRYPGSDGTMAFGINDFGHVVGQYRIGSGVAAYHGFIWKDGEYSTVDAPEVNGLSLALHGINKQGQSAGTYFRPDAVVNGDITVAVGDEIAFILDNGSFSFVQYPGGVQTFAYDINNSTQVVGLSYENSGAQTFFLYDGGEYFRITGLPDNVVSSGPWGINTTRASSLGRIWRAGFCIASLRCRRG